MPTSNVGLVVFGALAAAGLTIVTGRFDGFGDSGQIEDVEAEVGDGGAALPWRVRPFCESCTAAAMYRPAFSPPTLLDPVV